MKKGKVDAPLPLPLRIHPSFVAGIRDIR